MEQKYHGSPLSRICYQDSTFMLDTMLPFVPSNLKFPLAVMIKWSEFQRIVKVFQNKSLLQKYGLYESEFSMEKFTDSLSDCPNKKIAENISQMGQMIQMMQMMNAMGDMTDMDTMPHTGNDAPANIQWDAGIFPSDDNLSDEEKHTVNEIMDNLFPSDTKHEIVRGKSFTETIESTENISADASAEFVENISADQTSEASENYLSQENETFDIEQFIQEVFS